MPYPSQTRSSSTQYRARFNGCAIAPASWRAASRGNSVSVSSVITYFTLASLAISPTVSEKASGGPPDAFSLTVGDMAKLANVKYVITLDTDTLLPRDAARQLAGAMAHPLNRARYCVEEERVCEGYGILQPRVGASLPAAAQSRYARLFGSEPGIDPYTRAVSDVYQDLFGEGSFIGKGIYDVDAFEQALKGRFPDNRILSHDLVEGCYARCGLLTDVQVYEEYPARYSADVSRRHRWIRGDWQLLRIQRWR